MIVLAKYGAALTLRFPMVKAGSQDFAAAADWTPATGDTKVSKDGGNVANTSNNAAAVGGTGSVLWSLALTATELQAAQVVVQIVDAAPKAVEDQALVVLTYGHASAAIKADLDDTVRLGLTALPNAAAEAAGGLITRGTGTGQLNVAAGRAAADLERWLAGTPNGLVSGRVDASVGAMAAAVLTAAAIAADAIQATKVQDGALTAAKFAAGAFDAVWSVAARTLTAFGFGVTVATNNDKTGYGLTTGEREAVADAVWDEALAGHLAAGSTGEALEAAGAGADPGAIADAVWDEALAGHAGAGSAGLVLSTRLTGGAGALTRTIGVTLEALPVEGASVWLATDAAGANVVAGPLVTDSMGEVTVLVDAGTYYVWVQKDGLVSIIGQEVEIA